jgi:MFS transporter, DHA2 family, multidrug resistance protein
LFEIHLLFEWGRIEEGWTVRENDDASLNRWAIAACLMLGVFMQALDTTIANVALPYMQGSVSASQDEIAWVLTSYIVAAAIMTPASGFLANRFGIKRVYLVSIAGFTLASMLCGAAQSLDQIVLFRILQGICGAALAPLAQAVLYNIMPRNQQGGGMAIFGIAVMVGPVLGPVLGGILTEYLNWRYVFYVNLPFGIIAFVGSILFVPNFARGAAQRLDWFGFASLSIAIGALQILLDRGVEKDWFSSPEIVIETIIAALAFYLFLVHTFTTQQPFLKPDLFKNRNFAAGIIFILIVGLTYFASMALQPPYIQGLMNYPVVTTGLVMGPRGVGTMGAMLFAGRLVRKYQTRYLLAFGVALCAGSFYEMMQWTPDIRPSTIIIVGLVQGMGLGFLFVPLSMATLGNVTPEQRPEGASIYNLARNIGSSIGISIVDSLLTRNSQVLHENIAAAVTPFDRNMQPAIMRFWNPETRSGAAALDSIIQQQAAIIAYNDDYKILMLAMLSSLPLLFMFTHSRVTAKIDPMQE